MPDREARAPDPAGRWAVAALHRKRGEALSVGRPVANGSAAELGEVQALHGIGDVGSNPAGTVKTDHTKRSPPSSRFGGVAPWLTLSCRGLWSSRRVDGQGGDEPTDGLGCPAGVHYHHGARLSGGGWPGPAVEVVRLARPPSELRRKPQGGALIRPSGRPGSRAGFPVPATARRQRHGSWSGENRRPGHADKRPANSDRRTLSGDGLGRQHS